MWYVKWANQPKTFHQMTFLPLVAVNYWLVYVKKRHLRIIIILLAIVILLKLRVIDLSYLVKKRRVNKYLIPFYIIYLSKMFRFFF